jgi:MarR family transcriptional regulator, lower aerobic nicotinate degradation pathway regulator
LSRRSLIDTFPWVPVATGTHLPESLTHWPGYLLAFIAEHATERFEQEIEPHGIRSKHAQVLVVIDAEGAMSQRALGRRLRIDKSPMVGLVDDLERLGLAERRRDESDRRVQAIHLTDRGRAVLARIVEIADAEQARVLGVLDESEREVLHELLLRVAEAQTSSRDSSRSSSRSTRRITSLEI